MFNWIKKMWRWAFGPSVKSLNTEMVGIVQGINAHNPATPHDELVSMIEVFKTKAEIFAQDNPLQENTIKQYFSQLSSRLFQKTRFSVIEALKLESYLVNDDKMMAESINHTHKLAFLLYHGAQLPNQSPTNESILLQAIRLWASMNPTHEQYKPFLQSIYQREKAESTSWAILCSAFSLSENQPDMGRMLNQVKKLLIMYLFPTDKQPLTQVRLGHLFNQNNQTFKPYFDLLNIWPSKIEGNFETNTIKKLREASNEKEDKARVKIINNLLGTTVLDNVNSVDEENSSPIAAPTEGSSKKTGGFLGWIFGGKNSEPVIEAAKAQTDQKTIFPFAGIAAAMK